MRLRNLQHVLPHPNGSKLDPRGIVKRDLGRLGSFAVDDSGTSKQAFRAKPSQIKERLVSITNRAGAKIIDPVEFLCGESVCPSITPRGLYEATTLSS